MERTFSILKLIKTEQRNCLSENQLDDSVDGPPLNLWDATTSVDLWWKNKQRKVGGNKSDSASTSATSPSPIGNEHAPTFIDFLTQTGPFLTRSTVPSCIYTHHPCKDIMSHLCVK